MPLMPPKKWQQCQNESKWACSFAVCTVNRILKKIKTSSAYGVGHCNDGHPTTHHLRHMVDSNWIILLTIPNLWNWWLRVMQDSCTSREYHCLLHFELPFSHLFLILQTLLISRDMTCHFRWSQGPSLAPATWSPPSPRPTPSTHSGKPWETISTGKNCIFQVPWAKKELYTGNEYVERARVVNQILFDHAGLWEANI